MGFPLEYLYLVYFPPEYIYLVQSTSCSVLVGLVVRVGYISTHLLGFQQDGAKAIKHSWSKLFLQHESYVLPA
jgi:hypothetical protein